MAIDIFTKKLLSTGSGKAICAVAILFGANSTVGFAAPLSPERPECAVSMDSLPEGQTVLPISEYLTKPALGQYVLDPAHGTCITRLTDNGGSEVLRFAYSRIQAFNADDSRVTVMAYNGYWHLINTATSENMGILPGLAGQAEPQWHSTDPDLLYYIPNAGGMTLNQVNVSTGETTVIADFTGRLPWSNAAKVRTRDNGSPSQDQRWWAFMVEDSNWQSVGLMVWDSVKDEVVSTFSITDGDGLDSVTMSPSGKYVVAGWERASDKGAVAWTRDFSQSVQLAHITEHSDTALMPDGGDAYVSVDYQSTGIEWGGPVYYVDIDDAFADGEAEPVFLFDTYGGGGQRATNAIHMSGRAFERPGWVLLSTYSSKNEIGNRWQDERIFAAELKPSGRYIHLAHHRSKEGVNEEKATAYWKEPHATVNRDFTAFVFASGWDAPASLDVDTYMVDGLEWGDEPTVTPEPPVVAVDPGTCDVNDPSLKKTLPAGVWVLLSLPCEPPAGMGIGDVLGDDIPGGMGSSWWVNTYDTGTSDYSWLGEDDRLKAGQGFWILQESGSAVELDMPEGSTARETSPDVPGCAVGRSCFSLALAPDTSLSQWHHIGNPLSTSVPINDLRITTRTGPCSADTGGCSYAEAEAADIAILGGLIQRANGSSGDGSYETVPTGGALGSWDGFMLLQGEDNKDNNPVLIFPAQ